MREEVYRFLNKSVIAIIKWLAGLVAILIIGLIFITLYSAYYSFGTMIFGVHSESAIKDFWNTEFLLGTVYISAVLVITLVTQISRWLKNKK